jgi:hypothetical protein
MAVDTQRITRLFERALSSQDPTESLRALTELRSQLDQLERAHVARALEAGYTFTAVAAPLAISRQAAHRRYRDLAAPAPPAPPHREPTTVSPEARAALLRAREEAARHGAQVIESQHLLLGVARTGAFSLDIEAARRSLGPPRRPSSEPTGLHTSLRARVPRTNGPLGLDHLLRAALDDPGGGARRVLDRLGIPPQVMLDALEHRHMH